MKTLSKFMRKSKDFIQQKLSFQSINKRESEFLLNKNNNKQLTNDPKTLKYHKMQYPQLDKFFIRFFNSKPIQGRLSGKSLAFVIGAENVGKSDYIQKNIVQIKRRKKQLQSQFNSYSLMQYQKQPQFDILKSPQFLQNEIKQVVFDNPYNIIVKKNYKQQSCRQLNYLNFIEDLHDEIFMQLNELLVKFQSDQRLRAKLQASLTANKKQSTQENNSSQQPLQANLLTADIIKNIVIYQNAPQYVFVYIKDVIYAIIQDKDSIYMTKQHRDKLQAWNDDNLYAGQCTCQQFFEKKYSMLIDIIWKAKRQQYCDQGLTEQGQKAQIALRLFYSVFKRIQYQNRDSQSTWSWTQTGIQSSNFLFDILNFLSGTGKYLQRLQREYISSSSSFNASENHFDIKNFLQTSSNFIIQGNHIDIMMCLLNIEQLNCFSNNSKQFLNFFDHVVNRTVRDDGFRKHFPIIVQIPNRVFLDEISQLGKVDGSNPVIIQIPGYIQQLLKYSNIVDVFDINKTKKLFFSLGRNTHTWKQLVKHMSNGITLDQILQGKAIYQQKQKIIGHAKINRVYTSQRCLSYLNSSYLDHELYQVLTMFNRVNGLGAAHKSFYAIILFNKPYFKSLLEQNILYHMYYLPYMDYSMNIPSYVSFFRQKYIPMIKKRNGLFWMKHRYWRFRCQQFKLLKMQLKYHSNLQKVFHQRQAFMKNSVDHQLFTTYYGPLYDYRVIYQERGYFAQSI